MSRSVSYQIRLSDEEKNAAFAVFRDLGINPAQAVRLFLRQVVETRSIPFPIAKADRLPATTDPAFDEQAEKEKIIQQLEAKHGYALPRFASKEAAKTALDEWFEEGRQRPLPPELAAMTEDEVTAMVNEEVKQYRAEQASKKAAKPSVKR